MKSLDECRVEIFRRSEEKIKERRGRTHAIITCISLLVCIGISFSLAMSFANTKKSQSVGSDRAGTTEGNKEETHGTAAIAIEVEVRVGDGKESRSFLFKDEKEVQNIYYSIQSLYEEIVAGDSNNHTSQASPDAEHAEYTIIFRTANGFDETFSMNGNVLKNDATNETVILTDEQLEKLKAELSITE